MKLLISETETILRLVLACLMGGLIGYERQEKNKSAGLRTNILVCLGSCLIMIVSQELYKAVEGHTNADPARLAAQVVSGIGFLGAGAIMKDGLTVTGLTTAACVWVVSGVGLAIGAGKYLAASITTAIVFITVGVMAKIDRAVITERPVRISILALSAPQLSERLCDALKGIQLYVNGVKIKKANLDLPNWDDEDIYVQVEIDALNAYNISEVKIADEIRKFEEVLTVEVL